MKSSLSLGLLAIQMLLSGAAFAEPARPLQRAPAQAAGPSVSATENTEKARAHFTRGVQFYNNGDYKLALIEFRRAHELSHNYRVLYNIGQVNHQLGNYTKALAALEEYLRRGGTEIPEARRAEVTTNIAVLRKKTARIRLTVDAEGAELFLDDRSFGHVGRERTLTIDAGEHRLEVRKFGYRPFSKLLALAAGDNAEVRVQLVKLQPLTLVAASGPPTPKTSPLIWAGWSATGAFAVGAAVTGVLAVSNAKQLADLR
ncbi:MAG TPA: tetratricopeptide repeat protein, partial [Polyangiaceae bacterium]|nr:tetratricopeptide repeat protein [Polyangiaceae bacterium]